MRHSTSLPFDRLNFKFVTHTSIFDIKSSCFQMKFFDAIKIGLILPDRAKENIFPGVDCATNDFGNYLNFYIVCNHNKSNNLLVDKMFQEILKTI